MRGILTGLLLILLSCSPYQRLKPGTGTEGPTGLLCRGDLEKRFRVVLKDGTVDWGTLAAYNDTSVILQSRKFRGKAQHYNYRDVHRFERYEPVRPGVVLAGVVMIGMLYLMIGISRAYAGIFQGMGA